MTTDPAAILAQLVNLWLTQSGENEHEAKAQEPEENPNETRKAD